MSGPFKIVSAGLIGTVLNHSLAVEVDPPEKADPARYHVPGEPTPADTTLNISLAASTATGTSIAYSPVASGFVR